ncbi:uncharacterized protein PFB0145c-like [Anneissia japonica]|uniref:uncharacterized protein PFB0145c-like n=1 Tax=Anneissia japonica TaxID=1529436 RepID=UPI001425B970|nr:uncharacterized protein PFB0145c-like [Anneissia japonica]
MADTTNDTEALIPASNGNNNEEHAKTKEVGSHEEHVEVEKNNEQKQDEETEKPEVQTDVKNDNGKDGGQIENCDANTDDNLVKVKEENDVENDTSSKNDNQTDEKNSDEAKDEETIQETDDKVNINEANEDQTNESSVTSTSEPAEMGSETKTDDNTNSTQNDTNLEEMEPEELRRKISDCILKSDTLQIELDMAHAKVLELEDKVKTMSEKRKKSSESMSSNEAREKAKQRDGLAFQADYFARELSQQQNTEAYLREKLTETLEEKEELERKNKDLQLRLKRFTKDDQAKDERIARMEKELHDINTEVQEMEKLIDQSSLVKIQEMRHNRTSTAPNGETLPQASVGRQQTAPSPTSKTCVII